MNKLLKWIERSAKCSTHAWTHILHIKKAKIMLCKRKLYFYRKITSGHRTTANQIQTVPTSLRDHLTFCLFKLPNLVSVIIRKRCFRWVSQVWFCSPPVWWFSGFLFLRSAVSIMYCGALKRWSVSDSSAARKEKIGRCLCEVKESCDYKWVFFR